MFKVYVFVEFRNYIWVIKAACVCTCTCTYPLVETTVAAPLLILATSSLHPVLFSVFLKLSLSVFPVHSVMLSSHLFHCLPLVLPPCTVLCKIVLASPVDLVTCPYHFSCRLFTVVKRSFWCPTPFVTLFFTSTFVMWSLL